MSELGMLPIKNRARLADCVLPPRERIDIHLVIVPRDSLGVVSNLQSAPLEPIRQLDVLPGSRRKSRIEWIVCEQLAIDRDVRCVEEIEGHDAAVLDQP